MSVDAPASTAAVEQPVGEALALFPGMAAAFPGMGQTLAGVPAADRAYAEFSEVSGADVAGLACRASEGELLADRSWELAVVATEAAAYEAWRDAGHDVGASLGFSIGSYAALLAAGMVTVRQVVGMIDAVLQASRRLPGCFSMLGVVGAPVDKVAALCREGGAELAAVIAPGQLLVAGIATAVAELAEAVAPVALKVATLSVRWPLHTSLMLPVAEELERHRERLGPLQPCRHPVYSALHGRRIGSPQEGWQLLVEHLHRTQRFDLAFGAARREGFTRCVELGPGRTLEHAVRWLSHGEVEVQAFPGEAAHPGRDAVKTW